MVFGFGFLGFWGLVFGFLGLVFGRPPVLCCCFEGDCFGGVQTGFGSCFVGGGDPKEAFFEGLVLDSKKTGFVFVFLLFARTDGAVGLMAKLLPSFATLHCFAVDGVEVCAHRRRKRLWPPCTDAFDTTVGDGLNTYLRFTPNHDGVLVKEL